MPQLCNRCFRTTDEDMDNCPNNGDPFMPCPPPVEVSDDRVVIVQCSACPKVRAIPIGNIMQRKRLNELGPCLHDQCKAVVVLPSVERPSVPLPINGQQLSDMSAEDVGQQIVEIVGKATGQVTKRRRAKRRRAKRGKGK